MPSHFPTERVIAGRCTEGLDKAWGVGFAMNGGLVRQFETPLEVQGMPLGRIFFLRC
jgi:hypothetical protein